MRRVGGFCVGMSMALGMLFSRVAGAEDEDRKNEGAVDREQAASDRDNPVNGPSLSRTGRIGSTVLEKGGVTIDGQRPVLTVPSETAVAPVAVANDIQLAGEGDAATGTIDAKVLEPEIAARFTGARVCRLEVARHKRIAAADVRAKTLELRWTILPSGRVGARQVVATAPVDLDVMSCVKARMATWTFTAPSGGAVALTRTLTFP